ncbi:peptidase M20 [Izhakiella australiensis]|uniref:Probable succinyl-diaminopimelate desuccinylase n=1 Tax=Izhakiella australiensis TaxID=1926881 RepID=A0A1S8YS42_9GAMM|nr:M20 family metallopeptidase [Izhakiella australiensis]OON41646.1 peptidase M20 [Izhakiella australiensis]
MTQSAALTLAQRLLAFNTINPPGDEEACTRYLADWLQARGFDVQLQRFGPRRLNLIARLPGSGAGKPLAFTGHLDTVPLGAQPWRYDPFGSQIVDGRLYGRGASDMKAAVAAFACACLAQQESIRAGSGAVMLITGGEETGCDGARALIDNVDLPEIGALIVGESTANYPVVGHKGALWLRCATQGKTAHGAMPELGVNAIYLAADAIGRIRQFIPGAPHPLMKQPTLNVGRIEGGLNINSVPDRSWFDVDIRTAPNLNHGTIRHNLASYLGDTVSIDTLIDLPAVLTDDGHAWIQRVFHYCQPLHDEALQLRVVPYFTDASLLTDALASPPTVILGPGEPTMAHQTDEYCELGKLSQAQQLYGTLLNDWMQQPVS